MRSYPQRPQLRLLPAHLCVSAQVSREPPPPLPGGYTVGEQIYYTGASHTFESGDRVAHGKEGEVMGPATSESHKGNCVIMRFPGNKGMTTCYLSQVRRHCCRRPHSAH